MSDDAIDVLVIGCTYHDFETNGDILESVLADTGRFDPVVTTDKDELLPDRIDRYDAIVDYMTDSSMSRDQRSGFLEFIEAGGGYVGIHPAADISNFYDGEGNDPELEALLGAGYEGHPDQMELTVEIVDSDHPITEGLSSYTVYDEPYRFSEVEDARVLARTTLPNRNDVPYAWTRRYGDGRVFYHANGHTNEAFRHPTVQSMIVRGIEWATDPR